MLFDYFIEVKLGDVDIDIDDAFELVALDER